MPKPGKPRRKSGRNRQPTPVATSAPAPAVVGNKIGGSNIGRGRPKGSPNKITADIKSALTDAFDNLGGVPSLVKWGRANLGEFYKLWSKLVPKDVKVGGEGGGPVQIVVRVEREGRRITAS